MNNHQTPVLMWDIKRCLSRGHASYLLSHVQSQISTLGSTSVYPGAIKSPLGSSKDLMTKQNHFTPHFSCAHCFELVLQSQCGPWSLALHWGKGYGAHQKKAGSGRAFRPQDDRLAVTTHLPAQGISHLPALSPVFIWWLLCFSFH